jgi:ankyrin repeat protein
VCNLVASSTELVRELLSHPHIDVMVRNLCGWMPIHNASQKCGAGIVETLLLHRPEKYQRIQLYALDRERNTPLHLACYWSQNVAKINVLVRYTDTIRVNSMNKYGMTPLHMICSRDATSERLQTLQQLLSHPYIMIHRTKNDGRTSLTLAEERLVNKLSSHAQKYNREQVRILYDSYTRQRWMAYYSLMHMSSQTKRGE